MKKAINKALLAVFVLIARLACTQTVASNSNGLFLSANNSSAAQSYINATRTDTDNKDLNTTNLSTDSQTISNAFNSPEQAIVATNTVPSVIDERSIPLFTRDMTTATSPSQLLPASNSITSTLSLVTSLFALIVAALAVSWFIQKKTGIAANNFGKVLGMVPLDNKRIVYIVDVMGKMLVLGVTENNINYLTEITDKDTVDAYRLKYGQSVTPGLDKLFPFLKKSDSEESDTDDAYADEKSKREAKKQIENVKTSLETSHDKRIARLQDMIIKK